MLTSRWPNICIFSLFYILTSLIDDCSSLYCGRIASVSYWYRLIRWRCGSCGRRRRRREISDRRCQSITSLIKVISSLGWLEQMRISELGLVGYVTGILKSSKLFMVGKCPLINFNFSNEFPHLFIIIGDGHAIKILQTFGEADLHRRSRHLSNGRISEATGGKMVEGGLATPQSACNGGFQSVNDNSLVADEDKIWDNLLLRQNFSKYSPLPMGAIASESLSRLDTPLSALRWHSFWLAEKTKARQGKRSDWIWLLCKYYVTVVEKTIKIIIFERWTIQ